MPAPLTVRRADSKTDFNILVRFPWSVYQDDPGWVPPLVSMQRHKLDKKKNPTWEFMEGDYFIAWRGDRPVGTIAAFINHRHNEYWNERIGFFGKLELYNDQEAANGLLQAAADYVQAKGATALRGPMTFSTNGEVGVLIEGYDDPPVLLYTYNPPYYSRLIEAAPGMATAMNFFAYEFSLQAVEASSTLEQIIRVTRKNGDRRGITVRTANPKRLKQEFTLIKDIYNRAWERNWGFVPFSPRELDQMVHELGQFFDPHMAFFAEIDGRPVAFLLGLPDMNQVLHAAHPRPGKPEIITLLQMLWHWKIRSKITRVRIMLLGIDENFRGLGIDAALFTEAYQAGYTLGWPCADGGWVLETNEAMIRLVAAMNGRTYKRYRVYERALTAP